MKLIVGLGNPGKKFEKTRHNLGFRIIDELKKKNKFSRFVLVKEFNSLISKGKIAEKEVILAKPQTFMNNSGKAVKALFSHFKIPTSNLFVVHDDLDLPLGKFKISFAKGSANHKGVQSIIDELKTKEFYRFRVGINPNSKVKDKNFVLEKFNKKEEKILKGVIENVLNAIELALKEGVPKAMSYYNR